MEEEKEKKTLWSIIAKNTDCSTGPPACPFACSLAPLTRLLALDCSLCSRPPLRSLIRSLAYFAHSLLCGTVNDWMAILSVFFLSSTIVQRIQFMFVNSFLIKPFWIKVINRVFENRGNLFRITEFRKWTKKSSPKIREFRKLTTICTVKTIFLFLVIIHNECVALNEYNCKNPEH